MTVGKLLKEMFDIILQAVTVAELRRIVKYDLNSDLDCIEMIGNKEEVVFEVLNWAQSRQKLSMLVEGVAALNPAAGSELKEVFDRYVRINAPAPVLQDPLARFFPCQQPVIDRHDLEARLAELWDGNASGAFVVRGERWSGRSHSLWRIRAMAQSNGIQLHHVDISQDIAQWDVDLMIERLRVWFGMPPDMLADAAAQGSRKGLVFVGALYRQMVNSGRCCLVFDGLDHPGVNSEVCEFAERIVGEVINNNISNLSVILLGYGPLSHLNYSQTILEEGLLPLCRNDVRDFFANIANAVAVPISDREIDDETDAVMQDLTAPMDRSGMNELGQRVRQRAKKILKRARR